MGGVALKTLITDAVMDAFKAPTEGRFAGQYTTLDKSHCAKMVWENVYRRWDSLDDHTKDFFRTFVQLHKIPANCTNGKTWEPVTDEGELSRDISSSNMCNYRINLVSKCPGSDRKLFGETLPKLPLNLVCDVWYTGSNGNVQRLKVEGNSAVTENFFRDLYNAVYHSADSASVDAKDLNVPGTFDAAKNKLTVPVFSSSRGEYVRKHLEALVNQKPREDASVGDGSAYVNLLDGNVWHKIGNTYKKVVNGEVVESDLKNLKASDNCYSSGRAGSTEACHKHIFNCLLNDDATSLEQCVKNLENDSKPFAEIAREEINNIHPVVALRTLQRFGFHTHNVFDDEAGTRLKKVECVEHWLENFMKKTFTEAEVQNSIEGNDRLTAYLGMLTEFVNANPGILNKGFSGLTEEGAGAYQPSEFVKELGIERREEPADGAEGLYSIRRLKVHRGQMGKLIGHATPFDVTASGRVITPFGTAVSPGVAVTTVTKQAGGGDLHELAVKHVQNYSSAEFLKTIVDGVVAELNNRNKQLSEKDSQKLKARVSELAKTEDELLKTIKYIEEYNKLMDLKHDYTEETGLTRDGLEQLVKRLSKLQTRQTHGEDYIIRVLEDVRALCDGDGDSFTRL
jgi:hypothetical protein